MAAEEKGAIMDRIVKKAVSLSLTLSCVFGVFAGCNSGKKGDNNDGSVLRIAYYDAGVDSAWLEDLERKFETANPGVDVKIDASRQYTAEAMFSSNNHIIINSSLNTYIFHDKALSVTDIVEEKNEDGVSIYDRLSDSQKDYLYAINNECYFIPHYQMFGAIVYDVDMFEEEGLYFSKELKNGKSAFVRANADPSERSAGPDGVFGTYDDGLPATNEELLLLFKQINDKSITPLIWSGQSKGYIRRLLTQSYTALAGKTVKYNYTFDSGDDEITIITGFNGDKPVTSNVKISSANGYQMKQQAELFEALKLLENIVDNNYYDSDSYTTGMTMTATQSKYVQSSPKGKPIAMLVESNYWINEARNTIAGVASDYPGYADRRFGYMPLPAYVSGTHKDVEGTEKALDSYGISDCSNCYMALNKKNVTTDAIRELCKKFILFAYKDENLQEFTISSKTPIALNYTMIDSNLERLPYYTQQVMEAKKLADSTGRMYIYGSSNNIFRNVRESFDTGSNCNFWGALSSSHPLDHFKDNSADAKKYFLDMVNLSSNLMSYFK